jgi:cell division protein FtsI (penicillin-binding protein 3)
MEVKRDILWRVYLSFLGIVFFSIVILARTVYIQQFQGAYWIKQAKEQQQRFIETDAERGTIYSEDGSMLSTSIPYFDIYIDFGAEGLREKNGRRFHENLDSLSLRLSGLFRDHNSSYYKRILQSGYKKKDRYFLLKKNLSFQQYQLLRNFPLVRLGKNKSGFIAETNNRRLNPFGLLANRTIGLSREFIASDGKIKNTNVGLENTYDTVLKGESGKKLVRFIAGGVYVPVDGYEIEPEHGKDVMTTIDVNIQDIAETALLRMLTENESTHGTCIVMEVKTGKIKAIANLGRRPDGTYWEDLNYAIRASEPGSTFKLATMLALFEDNLIRSEDKVDLEKGSWRISGRTVYDSERHGKNDVTVKQAFEYSSNVGMAKLVASHYSKDPTKFIAHLKRLRFHETSGIDLIGETQPIVKTPKSKTWSATSLPWMSFGYEVLVSPLQTLMLYNAVANEGRMLRPMLVNSISKSGILIKQNQPQVLEESVCSDATLKFLQECLYGVCNEEGGTGYALFKNSPYKVAGKTGTALVANGKRGYADHIYQSSFAGYFPADRPMYSCIVVIKNKPFAKKYYGAAVAGPVFKEVADKLFARNSDKYDLAPATSDIDSSLLSYAGSTTDIKTIIADLGFDFVDSSSNSQFASFEKISVGTAVIKAKEESLNVMPNLRGLGLKDVLSISQSKKLLLIVKGKGKAVLQSISAGEKIMANQQLTVEFQ